MSTDTTLHDKIRSEVERRLAIARAAAAAKPAPWVALALHDGWEHTGYSGVRTDETTPTGRRSSPVATLMADTLEVERSSLASEPTPAAVAQFVALHDPADAIRRYTHALWILDQHQWVAPGVKCDCRDAMCSHGGHIVWPCDDIVRLAESLGIDTGGQP